MYLAHLQPQARSLLSIHAKYGQPQQQMKQQKKNPIK